MFYFVEIREVSYHELQLPLPKRISISDDKKNVTITFSEQKYYDNNGRETSKPSQNEVCTSLKRLMEKSVDDYNSRAIITTNEE